MTDDIRSHIAIPPHIARCADAVRADITRGPMVALIPGGDVRRFSEFTSAELLGDHGDEAESSDVVESVYCGRVGDTLRGFISDLPSCLYVCDDSGSVSEYEPEGEEFEGEWYEPAPYSVVSGREIVRALFGRTIAEHFA